MQFNPSEDKIIILGGGPSGVSAGFYLCKQGVRSTLIERMDQVGGLSRTLKMGDFMTDIGPHRFYTKNDSLTNLIRDLLGDDWIPVERFTRFYIKGKFYNYPIKLFSALWSLGPVWAGSAFIDYVSSRFKKKFSPPDIKNFEDYAVLEFGKTLAELNMLNYTEKVWGLPCNRISPDWATQRIQNLSLMEIIKKSLLGKNGRAKSLVETFFYPRWGAGQIYETMERKAVEGGYLSSFKGKKVVQINHSDNGIRSVVVENKDVRREELQGDIFVSSLPLPYIIEILNPPPPEEILRASQGLKFRSQVYIFLKIKKKSLSPDNWIYFPDLNIPFGRISEPNNFSRQLSPDGHTSLFVEYFVSKGDEIWNMKDHELESLTLKPLKSMGFLKEEDVIGFQIHRETHCYPVYDLDYRQNLNRVMDYLNTFSNFFTQGRGGRFQYNNQDHALESGILTAKSILENKRYNLDSFFSDSSYLEEDDEKQKV